MEKQPLRSSHFRKGRGFKDSRDKSPDRRTARRRHRSNEAKTFVPTESKEGWILFATNLHEEITEDEVMQAFSDFGIVKNLHLNLNRRTGFVKGYAMIEFDTKEAALNAKEKLNNTVLIGTTINVDWCFVKST